MKDELRLPGPPPEPVKIESIAAPVLPPADPLEALQDADPAFSTRVRDQVEASLSPAAFWVPAPKSKESERISVRIDIGTLAASTRLVESGAFSWESFSDFLRWAVFRGVQEASKALDDPEFSNEVRVLAALQRRVQAQRREALFAESLGAIKLAIGELVRQDARGDAVILLRETLADAEALTISRFKKRFIQELRTSFPDLVMELERQ